MFSCLDLKLYLQQIICLDFTPGSAHTGTGDRFFIDFFSYLAESVHQSSTLRYHSFSSDAIRS